MYHLVYIMSFGLVFRFFSTVFIETCDCKNVKRELSILKMILFKTVRGNLRLMGIYLIQSDSYLLSSLGWMKILIFHLLDFTLYMIYAFHGADDFLAYINTIFLASIQFYAFFTVADNGRNTKKIYNLLDKIEAIINASKKRVLHVISVRSFLASLLESLF